LKNFISVFLISLIGLLCPSILAQSVNFEWVTPLGKSTSASGFGSTNDFGNAITTDALGHVYSTGFFHDTVDFDPGVGVHNLISIGLHDVFIQKLDGSGNLLWAHSIEGPLSSEGHSITIGPSGNVYVTGTFYGTVDFDPGAGVFTLTSTGNSVFIEKLDSQGNFLWAKLLDETSGYSGSFVSTDDLGYVYVTGAFNDTVDFDPGTGVFNLVSNGGRDIFVEKLDSNGYFVWAHSMGGIADDYSTNIATDVWGNMYIIGEFEDTADFDPGAGTFHLASSSSVKDAFILKLGLNGNFVSARSMDAHCYAITADISGNIYITGKYYGTIDFDPSAGVFNLTAGYYDAFIQKIDRYENFIWAKSIGGEAQDNTVGISITTDIVGNVYITGTYDGKVDFDPGMGIFHQTANGWRADVFIEKLDTHGNFLWVATVGGLGQNSGNSITVDTEGNVYTTGAFEETVDFDPSSGSMILTSKSEGDVFILKLSQSPPLRTEESPLFTNVSIFPNPNTGQVNINLDHLKNVSVKVVNAKGQCIYQKENINTSILQLELNEAPGIYIIEIDAHGKKEYYKLVKK